MSQAGQDLRMPIMGGTRMPTDDSKSGARKLLAQSKGATEVGPMPSLSDLKPAGPTLDKIVPKVGPSTAGSLPKIGADIMSDPLIQYLRKKAAILEDNLTAMPTSKDEKELVSHPPAFSDADAKSKVKEHEKRYAKTYFDNKTRMGYKGPEKDRPAKVGEVDKILKKLSAARK